MPKETKSTDPRVLFGQRLTDIRKAKGLSQERLALDSGLARSYLGGVERGQRNIALLNICRLAETLGVTPATLLEPPGHPGIKQG
ncbi:helix-turn-helix domain-containing protein [Dyella sp. 20L07]|uniref:helix-turn-helix domain-containing protein n=1 Tax=Dyella sp. 20L07 TaxID=3384240 RepID=UPI003D2D20F5